MLIPYDQLEPDTLTRLIEDFVTREGTDNGDETPLQTRVLRVRHALTKGQAVIFFDLESQQCQLMLKHDVPKEFLNNAYGALVGFSTGRVRSSAHKIAC